MIRHSLRHILGRTIVVTNLDSALKLVDTNIDCAVTLDGEVATFSGILRAGSVSKLEGVRLGKQHRIEQLSTEIETMRTQIAELEGNLQQWRRERGGIDVHAISDRLRQREAAKATQEQSLNELSVRV